jgi:flagellar hook-basal body complex protein FliE
MVAGKIIDPNVAAGAYAKNMGIGAQRVAGGDDGVTFSEFLQGKARDAINTVKDSEKMSAKAVTGEADLAEVVQAVTAAELTLQTVIAVRDRLVSAYQDIMRLPI